MTIHRNLTTIYLHFTITHVQYYHKSTKLHVSQKNFLNGRISTYIANFLLSTKKPIGSQHTEFGTSHSKQLWPPANMKRRIAQSGKM